MKIVIMTFRLFHTCETAIIPYLLTRMAFSCRAALLTMLLAGYCFSGWSQDLHFSQFFNSPLTTNPANTGFIPDADYRIGANYRNQYINVMSVPYKTISVYGDAQVFRDRIEN